MPAQKHVRSDYRVELLEGCPPWGLGFLGKQTSLLVRKPDATSPAFEVVFEDAVLSLDVIDHELLLAIDGAGHSQDEEMPWLDDELHLKRIPRATNRSRERFSSPKNAL